MDQLSMDFVAYSENKCSQKMVLDYIVYLILREKEPRVVEVCSLCVHHMISCDNVL